MAETIKMALLGLSLAACTRQAQPEPVRFEAEVLAGPARVITLPNYDAVPGGRIYLCTCSEEQYMREEAARGNH